METGTHLVQSGVCRHCCSVRRFCNFIRFYSAWSALTQISSKFVQHLCLLFFQMIYLIYISSVESCLVWMFIPQAVLSISQEDLSVLFMVFIYLPSPLKAEFQHRKCWKCTVLQHYELFIFRCAFQGLVCVVHWREQIKVTYPVISLPYKFCLGLLSIEQHWDQTRYLENL